MKQPSRSVRFIALFFLADVLLGLAAPTVSYALTTGANQTEFTSYEPIGTTDMVNLSTGDFTYNVPLLDIPSPEGSFSLPLSYHSGVGLEDEASWVGLGWNVNPGAIARNKVSSADDDYDNFTNINVQDPGGSGYVTSYVLYERSWDSEKGYGGAINLLDVAGFSWNNSNGLEDGTVMGVTFNKDKVTFSMEKFFNGLTTICTIGAASAASKAAQLGTEAAASGATSAAATKAIALGKAEAFSAAAATGMDYAQLGLNLYNGYKSQGSQGSVVGSWSTEKSSSHWGFRHDYKYWLDNNRDE
ncbi:MAG: hypothetical protein M3Y54_07395, partial [Bacteroidota bacterium]|nr:hypothetical protein [Bacteroidota bacterium]